MADTVLLERDGAVARITLNRPEVGNALDLPTARALMEAVIACDEDDAVRCVLLTGSGRLFCVGGDVAAFAQAGDQLPAFLKEITVYVHAAVARLMRMNKPVVTAINGSAAGAGIGLAILGDIALADPRAQFTLAYSAIGLSPDGGTTWLLPRLIGLRRAQELCLRNRRLSAEEAAAMGLVTRVVEGDLMAEASLVAQDLARSATPALGMTRRLLLDSATASLEAQLDAESRGIASVSRTAEGKEGVAAFLEKRVPNFTGDK
ncbi:enoyl-CoA hydratase/isomerase family protein [Caulobacter sp. DWR1-3-2b1]|uniref:enoyl-CoA hydratase/isomerase family protein n=1 Tax=Caulobacter sp. DWR1-3-2b1 TaxID=2804670 RepID=UPI003CF0E463